MSRGELQSLARRIRASGYKDSPEVRTNIDGIAGVMVLVAAAVERVNWYDQSEEQLAEIERDARTVLHAVLDGLQI